jgi:hypothetical protein
MVPRLREGETGDAEALILNAIEEKRLKGGAAYARGKTLIVFLEALFCLAHQRAARGEKPVRAPGAIEGGAAGEGAPARSLKAAPSADLRS